MFYKSVMLEKRPEREPVEKLYEKSRNEKHNVDKWMENTGKLVWPYDARVAYM